MNVRNVLRESSVSVQPWRCGVETVKQASSVLATQHTNHLTTARLGLFAHQVSSSLNSTGVELVLIAMTIYKFDFKLLGRLKILPLVTKLLFKGIFIQLFFFIRNNEFSLALSGIFHILIFCLRWTPFKDVIIFCFIFSS